MNRFYYTFILMPLLLTTSAISDPIDTANDFLYAVECQDGYAMENLFAGDLYNTFISFFDQMRALADADSVLAESLIRQKYGNRVELSDLTELPNEEILSLLLGEIHLQSATQIEQESAQMEGRTATVVLTYFDKSSISFSMAWEAGDWKITNTSLLTMFF